MARDVTTTRFYDQYYLNEFDYPGNIEQVDYLISKIGKQYFKDVKKVLDVGCGVGIFGQVLKERYSKIEIYGIDISKQAIDQSRKNRIKSQVADIEKKWPYPDNNFDLVISQQVIEHVINPDHQLTEARRVLKKGGRFIITTPNLGSWYNRLLLFAGFQPFYAEVSTVDKTVGLGFTRRITKIRKPLGHLHVFTQRALKDLLYLHGFKVENALGGRVRYLPLFIKTLDQLISNFPGLASDLIIVARKS
jgi:ubiquinone/menaquinone biosynthesis C-methylase UbiE